MARTIDVYYYGEFSNNLHLVYDFGLTLAYSPAEGQDIQVTSKADYAEAMNEL